MASQDHIRNPIDWGWNHITLAALTVESLGRSLRGSQERRYTPLPAVFRIKVADLRDFLIKGLGDFRAYRTDVIFLCLIHASSTRSSASCWHSLLGGQTF